MTKEKINEMGQGLEDIKKLLDELEFRSAKLDDVLKENERLLDAIDNLEEQIDEMERDGDDKEYYIEMLEEDLQNCRLGRI